MKRWILVALLAQAAAGALAQASASAHAGSFRCGGVGEEDQRRIKAEASQHDLMLTFATTTGAYLADVDVQIRQGANTVLQGHCNGPLMLVDLARNDLGRVCDFGTVQVKDLMIIERYSHVMHIVSQVEGRL